MLPDLEALGLSAPAAEAQAGLIKLCAEALVRAGVEGHSPAWAFFVPGRIEVLGKHTDYSGGRSLLAATEQGFAFVATAAPDARIEVTDAVRSESASFELRDDLEPVRGHWSNYPQTVARRLARNFPRARRGTRFAFASNLPPAAGLSSSSALIVGTFLVLEAFNGLDELESEAREIESLASYLAAVENGSSFGRLAGDTGVGTRGGSEDHTAILCSRPGELAIYAFGPTRLEGRVELPGDLVFAVASSGVVAEKTGAALERFNRASRLARAVVEIWNERTHAREPHIAAILSRLGGDLGRLREALVGSKHEEFSPAQLLDRLEHFREESEAILPRAADSLERKDLVSFGAWVDRSRDLGARLLANQVPETLFLAQEARRRGAVAASPFGAGFGGSVWALVMKAGAEDFLEEWRAAYCEAHAGPARAASLFLTGASVAAFEVGCSRLCYFKRRKGPQP